jgi:hypothetical protein
MPDRANDWRHEPGKITAFLDAEGTVTTTTRAIYRAAHLV